LNCKEEVELSHSAVQALQVVVSQQPQCQQPCMLMHSGGFFSFSHPFYHEFCSLDSFSIIFMHFYYSIVKDSSADLGINSKIVQIRPTVKAVSTKI
jgi:hypothetical protein